MAEGCVAERVWCPTLEERRGLEAESLEFRDVQSLVELGQVGLAPLQI